MIYDRTALLERAERFALAQEQMAADASEDSQHWHHVALANLLRELAAALALSSKDVGQPTGLPR